MNNKAFIPFRLPSLNEYTNANRGNRYGGAKLKKSVQADIMPFINSISVFTEPVRVAFIWHEKTMRRDVDNVAFAKKFILDALVNAGKLQGDSPKYVKGFTDGFDWSGKKEGVEIIILEAKCNQ